MWIENLTEQQAKDTQESFAKLNRWFIYRRLTDGSYRKIGAITWKINYSLIPVKKKYFTYIFFSSTDYGTDALPTNTKVKK